MVFVAVLLVALAMIALNTLLDGVAVMLLWKWFMIPATGGALPEIGLALACGVSLFVALLTFKARDLVNADGLKGRQAVMIFLMPAFFIAFGWVIHLFV